MLEWLSRPLPTWAHLTLCAVVAAVGFGLAFLVAFA